MYDLHIKRMLCVRARDTKIVHFQVDSVHFLMRTGQFSVTTVQFCTELSTFVPVEDCSFYAETVQMDGTFYYMYLVQTVHFKISYWVLIE